MGRRYYFRSSKATQHHYHIFRMRRLCEEGVAIEGHNSQGVWQWTHNGEQTSSISYEVDMRDSHAAWIRVYYTNRRTEKHYDYRIDLTYTIPHYGGKRWWFLCPANHCRRRVAILYLGNVMRCRHCWNMAYASQNEAVHERLWTKMDRLAAQIGHEGGLLDGYYGKKPKTMHWHTYRRKKAALEQLQEKCLQHLQARFGRFW